MPATPRHLPAARGRRGHTTPGKGRFKASPIGYVHIDIAEVRTEQGKLYLFVAIDRTSKFAFAQLHERATRRVAADFLHALVEALPDKIHTVLSDNGTQFTDTLPCPPTRRPRLPRRWSGPPAASPASTASTPSTTPASGTASSIG